MKKIITILLLLLLSVNAYAVPPSRISSYTAGETILSNDVTANEDAVFNYLQAGVDTYKDLTILNADINTSANIQSSKINLSVVAQNIANTGTFTNTGNATITGSLTVTNGLTVSSGTITGIADFTDLETTFLSLPETTAPTTVASEGALYTKDTSGQPELFFREESSGDEVQITSAGVLKNTVSNAVKGLSVSGLKIDTGTTGSVNAGASSSISFSASFTSAPVVVATMNFNSDDTEYAAQLGSITTSGFTIYNATSNGEAHTFTWIAIGQ